MRDGEPWFVAKDVADTLGYGDTEAMTRRLKHNEKGYLRGVGTSGGAQEMSILNEPGLGMQLLLIARVSRFTTP